MEHFNIDCPNCKARIHVPFMRELKAKAQEEADILEVSAREELRGLKLWLGTVSLYGLLNYWFRLRRNR